MIEKITLKNFKRFKKLSIPVDPNTNIFVGDNEAGKSTLLSAIDIVLSGSRNKVETIGLESLFNVKVIEDFLKSARKYEELPELIVELYLSDQKNEELNGKNNLYGVLCDGLRLICRPNDEEYGSHIKELLGTKDAIFPFEFYTIQFKTFADQSYSGYKKYLKHILIDNSLMNSEYAIKEYIRDIYNANLESPIQKHTFQNEYRAHKEAFKTNVLSKLNDKIAASYHFGIKSNSKANLETDLTILENNVHLENKGKGKQCLIKTDLALAKNEVDLDVVLIEEPENHLSHANMNKMIKSINSSNNKQLFIATHSSLISTRLDLRKTTLINNASLDYCQLAGLPEDTAKFFTKAPDHNILEFVLSTKVILVEGDAEFILMDMFYSIFKGKSLAEDGITVISVDGTAFKRYLDLAIILGIKTAVITDNDGDHRANCEDYYADYSKGNILIAADTDIERRTFEICIYKDNSDICDYLFKTSRRTLSVQDFMLKNKTESAFEILKNGPDKFTVPNYIVKAFVWLNS